ncbi:hypothetical protein [Paenibacillus sp. FSL R7-0337]|uniref:hypothetical protein n=1 Tax=unclassified Paenibacillus TaxID=185978 RepID=UPI00096CD078|nr:hypothetical protein [Paenibacillus sp. FSL R7-0337]OMF89783.1 hypothetical protein BK147_24710 [Paenibacillus sp. FSL R7-0337]
MSELKMGLIEKYSLIVPAAQREAWESKGWVEEPAFRDFHYEAEEGEAMMTARPRTLTEIDTDSLLGSRAVRFSTHLGTYGMGGPGFFGLLLEKEGIRQYLVYAVWASGQYILLDGRVIECHLNYNKSHRPWISSWAGEPEEEQWDELTAKVTGSVVSAVRLTGEELRLELTQEGTRSQLVFYKYHQDLPPLGNGQPRKPAFEDGVTGDYIVLSEEHAVLHV